MHRSIRYKQLNEARSKILQGQEVVVNQLPNGAITISARLAAAGAAAPSTLAPSTAAATASTLSAAPTPLCPQSPASSGGICTSKQAVPVAAPTPVPAPVRATKRPPPRPRARAKAAQKAAESSAPVPDDATALLPSPSPALPCSIASFVAPLPVATITSPFHQSFVQALFDPFDTPFEDPSLLSVTAQLESGPARIVSPSPAPVVRHKTYATIYSIYFSIVHVLNIFAFFSFQFCFTFSDVRLLFVRFIKTNYSTISIIFHFTVFFDCVWMSLSWGFIYRPLIRIDPLNNTYNIRYSLILIYVNFLQSIPFFGIDFLRVKTNRYTWAFKT